MARQILFATLFTLCTIFGAGAQDDFAERIDRAAILTYVTKLATPLEQLAAISNDQEIFDLLNRMQEEPESAAAIAPVARARIAELNARLAETRQMASTVPEPPKMSQARRERLAEVAAFLDFSVGDARANLDNWAQQVEALAQGDTARYFVLLQDELTMVIKSIRMETAMMRAQREIIAEHIPTFDVIGAVINANNVMERVISVIRDVKFGDMAEVADHRAAMAREWHEGAASLQSARHKTEALCKEFRAETFSVNTTVNRFCRALRETVLNEASLFGILTQYRRVVDAIAESGTIDAAASAKIDAAEIKLSRHVDRRLALQAELRELALKLNSDNL